MIEANVAVAERSQLTAKIYLEIRTSRFLVQTIHDPQRLNEAFRLRHRVFKTEMQGEAPEGEDTDQFDSLSDHLGIYDLGSGAIVATCRLNSSLYSDRFYSEQEFHCGPLMKRGKTLLEIGRVCVDKDFRRGIVVLLLWRAIARYMVKAGADILFGCGSVSTLDPAAALLLYKFLQREGKVKAVEGIRPQPKFRSAEFDALFDSNQDPLSLEQLSIARKLLPPLCKAYFDIGCYVPCAPAFDHEFQCIDFLTVLNIGELDPKLKKKLLGEI